MLKIGVPSKGRLMEKTFDWFGARGVEMRRPGASGNIPARSSGVEGVETRAAVGRRNPARAGGGADPPGRHRVRPGAREAGRLGGGRWRSWRELGFGQADLIIAVPRFWMDVETVDDLDAAAAAFRAAHGHRLRIATKYHRLVREFLHAQGVADYQLVDSQGATEGTVKNGTAEAIADITSSGETLRANHLRVLSDGLVLRSQATLFRSRGRGLGQRRAGAAEGAGGAARAL